MRVRLWKFISAQEAANGSAVLNLTCSTLPID